MPWEHDFREGRRWPAPGAVAIVGSEAQDAVFLPVILVSSSALILGKSGPQRWLTTAEDEELMAELHTIAARNDLTSETRLIVDQALELVEYEKAGGTGIAVVPPLERHHLLVATERLGWPPPRSGWRKWVPWETQRQMVYDDRPDEPSAACHLQEQDRANALCGYAWEMLIQVPGAVTFADVPEWTRCPKCAGAARSA